MLSIRWLSFPYSQAVQDPVTTSAPFALWPSSQWIVGQEDSKKE